MFGRKKKTIALEPTPVVDVPRDDPRWVLSPISYREIQIYFLDGVDWVDAPLPPEDHQCTPQMWGRIDRELVERCACGGLSIDRDDLNYWSYRNERRHGRVASRQGS